MRLLVACPQCQRQYDASARAVGDRFRCHCGQGLRVRAPEGREAAVVRCSSCGGPREDQATSCGFCGADFTVHEQDMHTVCPGCLAVISDSARFCHHCGLAIEPEMTAGESTNLVCPECGEGHFLMSRPLGTTRAAAMECVRCGGLWLGSEVFQRLVDQAAAGAVPHLGSLPAEKSDLPSMYDEARWKYRTCPVCRQLMPRQHYGRGSGVILDLCRGHGLWFDANELPRIMDWIRRGGLDKVRQRSAELAQAAGRQRDIERQVESRRLWIDAYEGRGGQQHHSDLVDFVFRGLSSLFS